MVSIFKKKKIFLGKYEVAALKACHHPNVVKIIKKNKYALYFKKYENTLLDVLPLNEDLIHLYLKQILEGLTEIHMQNFIHHDIKPENLFIDDNKIIVGDLGSCLPVNIDNNTLHFVGSHNYCAPEKILGNFTEVKSDIWSLGILLYQMITNKLIFEGYNCLEVCDLLGNHDRLKKFIENKLQHLYVSEELKTIIESCLTINIDTRITVFDLLSKLK